MKYCIIVPAICADAQIDVISSFTREFGGCTVQFVTGFWKREPSEEQLALHAEAVAAARKKQPDVPIIATQAETNALIWSFGPKGREAFLKATAELVRAVADQDAVLFWTEPGEAQFIYRPQAAERRPDAAQAQQNAPSSSALN